MSHANGFPHHWRRMTSAVLILLAAGCNQTVPTSDDASSGANGSHEGIDEPATDADGSMIGPPPAGKLYFGAFPGDASVGAVEDDPSLETVQSFEEAVGAQLTWVYFSHNWYGGHAFPLATATWIRDSGAIPFIRLMLRNDGEQDHADPTYNLPAILSGEFDDDLTAWGSAAGTFGTPLLVEWGTECNGQWFSWNGVWNGGEETGGFGDPSQPDGPERFVAAYRHIVDAIRAGGADNITWVFHINAPDVPDETWNRFESYYPGDEYVDWLGISIYGAGTPLDTGVESFREQFDPEYDRLVELAPDKPIVVAEMGTTANNVEIAPELWVEPALTDLFGERWPAVIGFAWWNEAWQNDDNSAHDTTMRVQVIPELADIFRTQLDRNADRLQESPVVVDGSRQAARR